MKSYRDSVPGECGFCGAPKEDINDSCCDESDLLE